MPSLPENVAQAAGVNNAAINYYFGSKDNLLEETFTFTLSHFLSTSKKS